MKAGLAFFLGFLLFAAGGMQGRLGSLLAAFIDPTALQDFTQSAVSGGNTPTTSGGCGGAPAIHDNHIGWFPGITEQPNGCKGDPNKVAVPTAAATVQPDKCGCCPDGYSLSATPIAGLSICVKLGG